mmetsp:Transcript_65075/g.107953  ORF Transcript_65075/g.107953 Transcript_65075/m.107953 type:complete len:121 (+) Transcript_65075:471-833(+)
MHTCASTQSAQCTFLSMTRRALSSSRWTLLGFTWATRLALQATKKDEAINALEKIVKKKASPMSEAETIQNAISCLQAVLGMDFKPSDIEVGVVSVNRTGFARLNEGEIDGHLTAIAEKD